jgi:hypothetical protein
MHTPILVGVGLYDESRFIANTPDGDGETLQPPWPLLHA